MITFNHAVPIGDLMVSGDGDEDHLANDAILETNDDKRSSEEPPSFADFEKQVVVVNEPQWNKRNQQTRLVGNFKRSLLKQRINRMLLKQNKKRH